MTCHQETGMGMQQPIAIYPPIVDTEWINCDKERLIKLAMHGIHGKLELKGITYDPAKGVPPMSAVGAILSDAELAAVLTYARHSWGNNSGVISVEEVGEIRAETKGRAIFYTPEELLKEHPMKEKK